MSASDEAYSSITDAEVDRVLKYLTKHGEPKGLSAIVIGTDTGISYQRVNMIIERLLDREEIHAHKRPDDKHVFYKAGPDPNKKIEVPAAPAPALEESPSSFTCIWCKKVKKDTKQKIRAHEVHCAENPDRLMTPRLKAKMMREKAAEGSVPNLLSCAGCPLWLIDHCKDGRKDVNVCPARNEPNKDPEDVPVDHIPEAQASVSEKNTIVVEDGEHNGEQPEDEGSRYEGEASKPEPGGDFPHCITCADDNCEDRGKNDIAGCDKHVPKPEEHVNTVALPSNPVQESQEAQVTRSDEPASQVTSSLSNDVQLQVTEPAPEQPKAPVDIVILARELGKQISDEAAKQGYQVKFHLVEDQEPGKSCGILLVQFYTGIEEKQPPCTNPFLQMLGR